MNKRRLNVLTTRYSTKVWRWDYKRNCQVEYVPTAASLSRLSRLMMGFDVKLTAHVSMHGSTISVTMK